MNTQSKAAIGNGGESSEEFEPILTEVDISTRSWTTWNPLNIFTCPPTYGHAVVILNRPIHLRSSILLNVWKKARARVTVDGGTDRWITYLGSCGEAVMNGQNKEFLPDLITGDMDSISPDVLDKLRRLGVNVINTPDQDATDYTKALLQLGIYTTANKINLDGIYVFTETTGRLDHIIANINTLFKSEKLVGDAQVIQVSSDSLTWLLHPGTHRISIPEPLLQCNSWCALMPIGSRVTSITTTGLKWNLDCGTLEFGNIVSTSNTYSGFPEVTVTTDTAVLWSMDIEPLTENICSESAPPS
ncbi:thiamin pyrophosphokinase 1 [Diprion similis]|uniref:thiamin pyrophosphokinase 1 n=1 Tax=Diprion similis TaxID=362088 RepID=UPI001EF959BF|nr:thiamin pyrophosphokinase 1 [Diprion similis]